MIAVQPPRRPGRAARDLVDPDAQAASLLSRTAHSLTADGVTPDYVLSWGQRDEDPFVRKFFADLAVAVADARGDVFTLVPVLASATTAPEPCALPRAVLRAVRSVPWTT